MWRLLLLGLAVAGCHRGTPRARGLDAAVLTDAAADRWYERELRCLDLARQVDALWERAAQGACSAAEDCECAEREDPMASVVVHAPTLRALSAELERLHGEQANTPCLRYLELVARSRLGSYAWRPCTLRCSEGRCQRNARCEELHGALGAATREALCAPGQRCEYFPSGLWRSACASVPRQAIPRLEGIVSEARDAGCAEPEPCVAPPCVGPRCPRSRRPTRRDELGLDGL